MSIELNNLKLIIAPNPLLNKISKSVEFFDSTLQKLLDKMLEVMYKEQGIGLAAVQIGVLSRVLVMDTSYSLVHDDNHSHDHHNSKCSHYKAVNKNPQCFINPEIIEFDDEKVLFKEGCLSVPEQRIEVKRFKKIKVKYLDYNFSEQIKDFEGLESICLQHEIDHLNGITIVEKLSPLKAQILKKKLTKFYH